MSESPLDQYRTRLSARRTAHERWAALDARVSQARLAVFAATAVMAWLAFRADLFSAWWLVAPLGVFLGVVVWHDRVITARDTTARAIAFYERGIARIEDRWAGGGEAGLRFLDEEHLYVTDLDLFGEGSLFELLSIARTRAGEETLAGWLERPAPIAEIRSRQASIEELRAGLDLREALALAGTELRASVDTASLMAWSSAAPVLTTAWPRFVAAGLAAALVAAGAWWAASGAEGPFFLVLALEVPFALAFRRRVLAVVHGVDRPARDLDVLAHLLERLEQEAFAAEGLRELRASLDTKGLAASAAIRRLHRLAELHQWQHNLIFAPVAAALLWSTQIAWAVEAWRRRFGVRVPVWLATVGECEAVSSLAAYAYEHPADPFPELVDGRPATFEAIALGHPLVPAARMVPNDVTLAGSHQLLIVSGSNMSGKSTLLRTVGVNTVLALAGAPVRAARLRLTPVNLGATLRIQDSLREGRSRFYAEISRIRRIADLADDPRGLLFLFDELLQGTNSHDRVIGATGVLRSLADRGAIGLVTTHDLALTAIADDLQGRAANVHFEDRIENGVLHFDYRVQPGPVTRGHALALMRSLGLDVAE